uniref:uncharacterized protein LOC105349870 isoform X4 n=1 Tax=Fragaria vesca subsp. vesca TaxID=101020 RepID=UPI0005C96048|nr:PREDICTED: uncharacterized protein LOC105349870 isoform X4 [Fragaria vesca subsp. vesca]
MKLASCSAFLGITSCVAFPIASKKNGRSAAMNRHDIHTVAAGHPVCSFIVWISFINIDAAAVPEAVAAVPEAAVAVEDIAAIRQITNAGFQPCTTLCWNSAYV